MFDKYYDDIRISPHTYQRAAERLPIIWKNECEGEPAYKNWIVRRVRRAQQQGSLSPYPPAWSDIRIGQRKKSAWVVGSCDGLQYGILVEEKVKTLLVITVITYDL